MTQHDENHRHGIPVCPVCLLPRGWYPQQDDLHRRAVLLLAYVPQQTQQNEALMQMNLFTYCAQCGSEHPATETHIQVIHRGRDSTQYHFCSQSCQQHFAQAQMRRLEGSHEEDITRSQLLADIVRRLG